MDMPKRFIEWIRQGYPSGVPAPDHQPLFALLRRQLTAEEAEEVARGLAAQAPLADPRVDAGVGAMEITDEVPSEADIQRVLARLRAHGALPSQDGERA